MNIWRQAPSIIQDRIESLKLKIIKIKMIHPCPLTLATQCQGVHIHYRLLARGKVKILSLTDRSSSSHKKAPHFHQGGTWRLSQMYHINNQLQWIDSYKQQYQVKGETSSNSIKQTYHKNLLKKLWWLAVIRNISKWEKVVECNR